MYRTARVVEQFDAADRITTSDQEDLMQEMERRARTWPLVDRQTEIGN